jgi:hypothetical protein
MRDALDGARIAGPATVAALTTAGMVLARKILVLAAAIPGGAFLVTWYVTFPLAHAALPMGFLNFDNVANVWLFVASVGATGLLLGYAVPTSGRRQIRAPMPP